MKCFCGFDHGVIEDKNLQLLADAYHDLVQGAHPDKEWMDEVKKLADQQDHIAKIKTIFP